MEALQQENHCSDIMATEQGSIASHRFRADKRPSGGALLVSALILNILHIIGHVDCYNGWSTHGSQPKVNRFQNILNALICYCRSQSTMYMDPWRIQ